MNQIIEQVNRAHRRMLLIKFAKLLCLALFAGLSLAVIGLAIPKIWHLPFLNSPAKQQLWLLAWPAGGILSGILAAAIWTWLRRGKQLDSAIEIDQRFALKERLSTALALSEDERRTEAGQALVRDANERAEAIDVRDEFKFKPDRLLFLPVIPALLLAITFLIPDAAASEVAAEPEKQNQEIKVALEEPRKKIQEKSKEMEAKGLKEAAEILKSLQKKIDNLSSNTTNDRKQALIELNNARKQIADRQQQLGGDSKEMKQKLNQLKRVEDGAARKLSEAINDGDFKDAQKAIRDLVNDLKNGKLSEAEQRKLSQDLAEIAKELQKMADRHEQQKQDLKDRIRKATQDGDLEQAARLQQKLEKMKQQDQQIQKMNEMGRKLQNCSDCMKQGNGQPKSGQNGQPQQGQQGNQPSDAQMQEAMKSLEDLQGMMQQLENEMDELKDLEDVMQNIEEAKNACNGRQGNQNGQPQWRDWAQGGGTGAGKRDKQESETGTFKSQVPGKLQPGETVVTGNADGRNLSGQSISEVRESLEASMNRKADPLAGQKLPRAQREHARQYFDRLREN